MMLQAGDILDFPPLNTKIIIRQTAADTGGESFEMEWQIGPRAGGTPVHVHRQAVETFEVLQGQLDVLIDGNWRRLSVGERIEIPPGSAHTFRNASDDLTRVVNIHRPALRFDEYFEKLGELVRRGIFKPGPMDQEGRMHLAMLMTAYDDELRPVMPPYRVMRFLATVGRMRGFRL